MNNLKIVDDTPNKVIKSRLLILRNYLKCIKINRQSVFTQLSALSRTQTSLKQSLNSISRKQLIDVVVERLPQLKLG